MNPNPHSHARLLSGVRSPTLDELFDRNTQTGFTQLEAFVRWLDDRGWRRLLIVVDSEAAKASGAEQRLRSVFNQDTVVRFNRFSPNPSWEELKQGQQLLYRPTATDWDAVVGLGGGTAIDLAKALSTLDQLTDTQAKRGRFARHLREKPIPLLAIPTTAGTGSEATQFAVVYVDGQKHSIDHPSLLPTVAVVDWTLMRSLPQSVTASSGLDATCQAIESMWNVRATVESFGLAHRALQLAASHLEAAVHAPADRDRMALAAAAHLAGRAINVTRTTGPHALSYFLTSRYGLPHGFAVALCLGPCLRQLSNRSDPLPHRVVAPGLRKALPEICRVFDASDAGQAADRWSELLRRLGCPTRLSEVAGTEDDLDLDEMVDAVNLSRLANHPVALGRDELRALLETIH